MRRSAFQRLTSGLSPLLLAAILFASVPQFVAAQTPNATSTRPKPIRPPKPRSTPTPSPQGDPNGTWTADASGNWSDATKWSGGIIADGGGTADFSTIGLTADRTVMVDTSRTIGILNVGSNAQFHSYNILTGAGATLTFDNISLPAGTNAQIKEKFNTPGDTVGGEIRLKSSLDLFSTGLALHLTGHIASSATSGTQTLSLQSGRADIAAVIDDGSTGGKIALLVTGGSRLTILGTNNTYTGGTTVTSRLVLGSGGPGVGQVGTIQGDIALTGNASSTLEVNNGTFNTHFSGAISGLGGLQIEGVDSAHRGLVTFDGSANNTYTGGTSVSLADVFLNKSSGNAIDGQLTSSINAADVVLQASTLTWQGDNQLGDGVVIAVQHDSQAKLNGHTDTIGGLVISAAKTSFSTGLGGNLTTTRGILFSGGGTANFASEFIINANATVNLLLDPNGNGGNPSLIITGAGTPSITFGAMRVHGASEDGEGTAGGVLQVGSGGMNMSAGVLLLGSDPSSPGRLNLFGNLGTSGSSAPSLIQSYGSNGLAGYIDLGGAIRTFSVNSGGFGTNDLEIDAPITNGGIIKNLIGNLTLGGANTYGGGTTINAGTVRLSGAGTLGAAAGALTVNSALLNLNGTSQMVGALNGTSSATILNNLFNTNSTLTIGNGGGSGTYDGLIRDTSIGFNNSTVALTKAGNGTETLTNANTYTGGTTLSAGTLNINNAAAIGAGVFTVNGSGTTVDNTSGAAITLANNNAFNLSGGNLTFTGTNDLNLGSGNFTMTNADRTVAVTNSGATLTIGGSIQDAGQGRGLTKSGAGTLLLTGSVNNTYTGLTTVSQGELDLAHTSNTRAIGADALVNGGTLKWVQNNEQMSDSSALTLNSGTVNLNSRTESLGTFTNNGGTFLTGAGGSLYAGGASGITWAGGTNTVNSGFASVESRRIAITGGTNTIEGGGYMFVDSGGPGLEMTGAMLHLNADNSAPGTLYLTGTITSHASAVTSVIDSAGAGSIPGTLDLAYGNRNVTVEDGSAAIDLEICARIINGALTKLGPGTLELCGPNTYTGLTDVEAGTLLLTGSLNGDVSVATGATLDLGGTNQTIGALSNIGSGGGTVLNNGGGTSILTIGNGDASGEFDGNIIDHTSGSGIIALTKIGYGSEILGGNNNYTGGTNLDAGYLILASAQTATGGPLGGDGSIASVGPISFNGGILQFTSNNTTDYSSRFSTAPGQLYNLDTNGQNVSVGSPLTSAGGTLSKFGNGTLGLEANNTYTGETNLYGGILALASPQTATGGPLGGDGAIAGIGQINFYGGTLQFTAANTTDYSSRFSNADNQFYSLDTNGQTVNLGSALTSSGGSLQKLGDGTLILSGANTYNGGTEIDQGTLQLYGAGTLGNTTAPLSLGNGVLDLNGTNQTIGSLFDVGPGGGTVLNNGGGTSTLTLGSGDAYSQFNGSIIDHTSGAGVVAITKVGGGYDVVGGNNTYTGGTNLNGGTLQLLAPQTATGGPLGGDGTIPSIGTISFNGGTLQFSSNNTTDYSSRFSTGPNQAYNLDTNGQTISVGSPLTSAGGTLTKLGDGKLSLDANNTYTGGTNLNGGILSLNSPQTATGGPLGGDGTIASVGTISFKGGTLQFTAANTTDYSSRFSNVDSQSYNLDTNGQTVSVTAALSSNGGSLTKLGDGTLVVSGANSYNGGTFILGGTLQIAGAGTLGSGGDVLVDNSVLDLNGTNQTINSLNNYSGIGTVLNNGGGTSTLTVGSGDGYGFFAGQIIDHTAGTGVVALSKDGAGQEGLGGVNAYTGATNVINGLLYLTVDNSIATSSSVSVAAGATFDISPTATQNIGALSGGGTVNLGSATLIANNDHGAPATSTFDGVIQDNGNVGNLVKAGTGTLTLTGTNTYSGTTTVNGGTLLINGDQSAATGAVSVNNSGATLGGTGTVGGPVTVDSGAQLRGGTGATASGSLTLANNVTLNSGSIIELALGPAGAHSTLARTGGAWSFDPTQAFHFIDLGAQSGIYDNIITGLASDPGTEASWTITNPGWLGTFTFDGTNIDLTLAVVPVPESSTWLAGGLAFATIAFSQRRRFTRPRGQGSRSI